VFRRGITEHLELRALNREKVRKLVAQDGGCPESLGIDLSLFPMAHTQWMWGQLAAKLVRIGTQDEGGPQTGISGKELAIDELRWKSAADMVLTLSPDVGTSTNISPILDQRIYGPDYELDLEEQLALDFKHPDLVATDDPWTRHIRFEIAEANCMSAAGAFGKLGHYLGVPFFPMMTVYDFFIKRALDQLYYNLYWGSEFVIVGTPSGITLSPEGAQHSWKSDIQIPNLITWEPLFAIEMDWILSDAVGLDPIDPLAWELVQSGVAEALSQPGALAAGDPDAYEGLVSGLILSGLAMQVYAGTRPASGAEHYFSHPVSNTSAPA